MHQLKIGSIPLPKLYVVNRSEAAKARKLGVPYIIKPVEWSDEKLVKAVLWRTLNNKFPYIKWRQILDIEPRDVRQLRINIPEKVVVSPRHRVNPGTDTCGFSSSSMEVTEDGEYRSVEGGLEEDDVIEFDKVEYSKAKVDDYIGDLGFYVNVEELQALRLLPTFLDDIANAIKINLMNTAWADGYNKKLGCNLGSWNGNNQAPNLIVLDTSGSIPSGVAGTMISLIDTLRHQCNADLIITSGRSVYFPANDELPDPDKLSYLIGGCNECTQFYAILREHILGRRWGNVIIFGDQDSPMRSDIQRAVENGSTTNIELSELQSTRIERIMAFHTYSRLIPGYGLWARDAAPRAEVVYNTDWVRYMR